MAGCRWMFSLAWCVTPQKMLYGMMPAKSIGTAEGTLGLNG